MKEELDYLITKGEFGGRSLKQNQESLSKPMSVILESNLEGQRDKKTSQEHSNNSWALLSGDQGYYSSSSEACQDHQKVNSFTPFPNFDA